MTIAPAPPPRLHTLAEVAARYGLSLRSLRERARAGLITHIHLGRERYLTDEMVSDLLARSTITATAPVATTKREADLARVADRLARRQPRRRPTQAA